MEDQKLQIIDKLRGAKNVLVTVSADPTVDQLASCIALTLLLNKLDKHATAVYSGKTPSTIEFLQPEETIEKNTDSLRDFIIALDKAKADKLRYKVEEDVVKIFITPYRTSLSNKDLRFSQGDFNVDIVVALGVHRQQDLDAAITAHGRILHDATVVTINNSPDGDLGTIHWQDLSASSLAELVASLATGLSDSVLDGQIATALLTGIVAETERFRNNKTTPRTMSISAELMAVGANQQLVAEQLEDKQQSAPAAAPNEDAPTDNAGQLEIAHQEEKPIEPETPVQNEIPEPITEPEDKPAEEPETEAPKKDETPEAELADKAGQPNGGIVVVPPEAPIENDSKEEASASEPATEVSQISGLKAEGDSAPAGPEVKSRNNSSLITEPPALGGVLTANSRPEALDPATEELALPPVQPSIINRADNSKSNPLFTPPVISAVPPAGFEPTMQPEPPKAEPAPRQGDGLDHETLTEIEQTVHHEEAQPDTVVPEVTAKAEADTLDTARLGVEEAFKAAMAENPPLEPVSNLNWQGEMNVQEPANAPVPNDVASAPAWTPPMDSTPPAEPAALPPIAPFAPSMPTPQPFASPQPAPFAPPMPQAAPSGGPIVEAAPLGGSPADQPLTMPLPPSLNLPPSNPIPPTSSPFGSPVAPPPLTPPPFPPPAPQSFMDPNRPSQQ